MCSYDRMLHACDANYLTAMRTACQLHDGRMAFKAFDGREIRDVATYAQLWEKISQSVRYFAGIGTQLHVVLVGKSSFEWFVIFSGLVGSGSVVIPLDDKVSDDDISCVLHEVDADVLVTDRSRILSSPVKTVLFDTAVEAIGQEPVCEPSRELLSSDPDRACVFIATSGSTAKQKYCMLSQRNIIVAALNLLTAVPVPAGGRAMSMLPFSHCFGLSMYLLYELFCGSCLLTGIDSSNFFNALAAYAPRYVMCVPSVITAMNMYFKVIDDDALSNILGNLRYVFCGGAPLNSRSADSLVSRGVELLVGYGLTECSPLVSVNRPGHARTDTVGQPCAFVDVRLVDGEVEVRSPAVMLGYYDNVAETAKAMDGDWLRTGDLGRLDDDGSLIITGRKKNIIVLPTGENVSPEEIEQKVLRNDKLEYCKVYERNGHLCAEVFTTYASPDEVHRWIRQVNDSVVPYKRILECHVLSEAPQVTALGKVIRR